MEGTGESSIDAASELVHGRDVVGPAREADDDPVARVLAELLLDLRDRTQSRVDLIIGLAQCSSKHVRVLPDLDRREMEAERFDLARKGRELTVSVRLSTTCA